MGTYELLVGIFVILPFLLMWASLAQYRKGKRMLAYGFLFVGVATLLFLGSILLTGNMPLNVH